MFPPNAGDIGSRLVVGRTLCSSLSSPPKHGSGSQSCVRLRALASPTCMSRQSREDLLGRALSTSVTAAGAATAAGAVQGPQGTARE